MYFMLNIQQILFDKNVYFLYNINKTHKIVIYTGGNNRRDVLNINNKIWYIKMNHEENIHFSHKITANTVKYIR